MDLILLYKYLSIAGFVLAGIFLIVSVLLYYTWKIPKIYNDLTGKSEKKRIEEIKQKSLTRGASSRLKATSSSKRLKTAEAESEKLIRIHNVESIEMAESMDEEKKINLQTVDVMNQEKNANLIPKNEAEYAGTELLIDNEEDCGTELLIDDQKDLGTTLLTEQAKMDSVDDGTQLLFESEPEDTKTPNNPMQQSGNAKVTFSFESIGSDKMITRI